MITGPDYYKHIAIPFIEKFHELIVRGAKIGEFHELMRQFAWTRDVPCRHAGVPRVVTEFIDALFECARESHKQRFMPNAARYQERLDTMKNRLKIMRRVVLASYH